MNAAQQINQTSGIVEYYTPPKIMAAVREVLGEIDLDPASSAAANRIVKAKRFFTAPEQVQIDEWTQTVKTEDGTEVVTLPVMRNEPGCALKKSWKADSLWLNHPFSKTETGCHTGCTNKSCIKRGYHLVSPTPGNTGWVEKFILSRRDFGEGCCITYACSSEKWYQPLAHYPQCMIYPRTNYLTPDGKVFKGVTKGSVVTYLGDDLKKFCRAFGGFGVVKVKASV